MNYLGKPNKFQPFVSKKMKLTDGDVLLLCTAGFWGDVSEIEMADALEGVKDSEQYTDLLEEILLSRQRKVVENYTVAAIFVNKVYQETNKNKMKYIKNDCCCISFSLGCRWRHDFFYQVKQAKKISRVNSRDEGP
ncbi:hypothetical protein OL548_26875 [Lysinibacillus sp. MHQ-1]|nr:hypothetical protein OL548_26875 [Lysinibacillus sp. MHQ-1]